MAAFGNLNISQLLSNLSVFIACVLMVVHRLHKVYNDEEKGDADLSMGDYGVVLVFGGIAGMYLGNLAKQLLGKTEPLDDDDRRRKNQ